MTLVVNFAHDFSLLLSGWTLLLALCIVACAMALLVVIAKGRFRPAAMLALALVLSIGILIPNSLLATPATWQTMYAAYVAAPPERSNEYAGDIHEYWSTTARDVLVRDWYFMAHRWGICHELWSESDCVRAPSQREPMGMARDLLTEVAQSGHVGPYPYVPGQASPTP